MADRYFPSSPPHSKKRTASGALAVVVFALAGVLIGVLVASNLDLSPSSVAQSPTTSASQGSSYPVVEVDGELQSPFVSVVQSIQDAVVNISAKARDEGLPWWHRETNTSNGSGFFFRSDGYVLTNYHVIADGEELVVRTSTGYAYDAVLVGADPHTDLAVLKIEPEEEIVAIPFGNSDSIRVGDWAIAIGNPFPQQGLDRTVTVGVISAKGRSNLRFGSDTPRYQNYIQTDASINPGNSGGPLLNLRGECIGVNAAISSPTGSSVGIGFAIPINIARAIVPDLISSGRASRGWLGVYIGGNVSEREARRQGMDAVYGVVIDSVFTNSPAQRAGLRDGDVIASFNGKVVENVGQFTVLVSTIREGQTVPIEVFRNGERLLLQTIIGDRDTFLAGTETRDDFELETWLGMEVITFTPQIAQALGLEHVDGVYVRRIYANSPASNSSITRGTIILQVNDVSIESLSDLRRSLSQLGEEVSRIPLIVQEPDGTIARKVIRR
ncbi:PDZ domain-containing protein [candidate division GN15 bacterium]|nr:PDZ domain-containing protein [candidate division GN15 bacterium]